MICMFLKIGIIWLLYNFVMGKVVLVEFSEE